MASLPLANKQMNVIKASIGAEIENIIKYFRALLRLTIEAFMLQKGYKAECSRGLDRIKFQDKNKRKNSMSDRATF